MLKVLLIGSTNLNSIPFGGEEFKNQILFQKLTECYNCDLIDTINWRRNPFIVIKLLFKILLQRQDSIIISASSLSSYRLIKILSVFPKVYRKTNYFVIGGYFPKGLYEGIYKSKYYRGLNKIVVEGQFLKEKIVSNHPLNNVEVIPNFKRFDFAPKKKTINKSRLDFVFISLITEDKGCDTIFGAISILKKREFSSDFTVSFYGKVDGTYQRKFQQNIGDEIRYKGYLDIMNSPNESYLELSSYDCLLFPTYFIGEGFPGVLIDSFITGLPTIVSDWHMNTELVKDGYNGLVVPVKDEIALANAMQRLIENPKLLDLLSKNAHENANRYHIDSIWPRVKEIIE